MAYSSLLFKLQLFKTEINVVKNVFKT